LRLVNGVDAELPGLFSFRTQQERVQGVDNKTD
jgi:hypothetical protein